MLQQCDYDVRKAESTPRQQGMSQFLFRHVIAINVGNFGVLAT